MSVGFLMNMTFLCYTWKVIICINRVGHGHCGLIVYVHETFLSKEIVIENANTSWDYLCVQLSHNSPNSPKNILCNVYRLPCYLAADIDLFNAEFCSLLRTVKHRNSSVLICGEFNIDLLSVTSNRHVTEYFDNVISSGFFSQNNAANQNSGKLQYFNLSKYGQIIWKIVRNPNLAF